MSKTSDSPAARADPRGAPVTAMRAATGETGAATTTRERILDVAQDLFVRKGYAETSLREIAAELGLSKAALYYHFESKQAILYALHGRLHSLTDGLLPLLQAEAGESDAWEQLVDRLITLALKNRRLVELSLRNQKAIAELHSASGLAQHGPRPHRDELNSYILGLLSDASVPTEQRVRKMAALGAVAGVLLSAGAFANVPDAELETTLRGVVRDILGTRPDEVRTGAEG